MFGGLASRPYPETHRAASLTHVLAMLRLPHPRYAAVFTATLLAVPLAAQRPPADTMTSAPVSDLRYEVTADRAALAARRLRVTTTFTVGGANLVVLSLPDWTPGAYEISNFANRVIGFGASQDGTPLRWDKLDYDSWRVRPTGAGRVTLTFDFVADTLDNAMAWTRPEFALFNGTNLFLYPEGRPKEFAAEVIVHTEPDFRVATSMPSAGAARTYRASNYHDLVDMPMFVGRFDLDSATISGTTVRYATYPMGTSSARCRGTATRCSRSPTPATAATVGSSTRAPTSTSSRPPSSAVTSSRRSTRTRSSTRGT
jgi:hypothetical protein